ncbi:MAG: hypothetical protein ACXWID_19585 [Pyrinomonadaceae bacterium]
MKQRTILSIFALALTLACAQRSSSQEAKPNASEVRPSQAELIDRFTKILDEQLEKDRICLSFRAGIDLERVIKESTAAVIHQNAFDRLPEAEGNFRLFAEKLIESARSRTAKDQTVRITFDDVRQVLSRANAKWSLCPLFPICN